jgi:hypothetical protein
MATKPTETAEEVPAGEPEPVAETPKMSLAEVVERIRAGRGEYHGAYVWVPTLSAHEAVALIESATGGN